MSDADGLREILDLADSLHIASFRVGLEPIGSEFDNGVRITVTSTPIAELADL